VAGPVLGGVLTDKLSWRWCFYINLPCGLITLILLVIFFENPRQASSPSLSWKQIIVKLDLLGTALFVPAITVLMLALQWGGSKYGWEDARIIVLICVSAILLAGFAFQQWKKGDNATLPARLFANRSLLAGFWFSFCNGSALAVIEYYVRAFRFFFRFYQLIMCHL
jgi:MFS family permease